MATKPLSAFTHATDANFSSGPASGNPTKLPVPDAGQGFVPDTGIAAEHVNSLLNNTGLWLTSWVFEGTSSPTEDAHILETNLIGKIFVIGCEIGSVAKDASVLLVNNASALQTIFGQNSGTGRALRAIGGTDSESASFEAYRAADAPVAQFLRNFGVGGFQRGTIHLDPQSTPASLVDGDVWKIVGSGTEPEDRGALVIADAAEGGKALKAWATEVGYRFSHSDAQSPDPVTTVSDVVASVVDLTVDPPVGKYKVTFSCSVRVNTGAADKRIQVRFEAGGKSRDYFLTATTAGDYMPLSATWILDVTTTTVMQISLASPDDTTNVGMADAEIIFEGAYDRMEIPAPPPP